MSWEYGKGFGRHRIFAPSLLIILFSVKAVTRYFFSFILFPPCLCCRRKGRHLNFQMDLLLLQERVLKKKAIMLDLNFRELEGVFTSLDASFHKEIKMINLHPNDCRLNINKSRYKCQSASFVLFKCWILACKCQSI